MKVKIFDPYLPASRSERPFKVKAPAPIPQIPFSSGRRIDEDRYLVEDGEKR